MGFWTRLFLIIALIAGVPYYWLMIDARTGSVAARPIPIDALRRAAQALPGQKPVAVQYVASAVRRVPGTVLVAGGGLKSVATGAISYRLVTPGGDMIIDSGIDGRQARSMGFMASNAAAQHVIDGWMRAARTIVFTHEHLDHVGGFIASPAFAQLAPKAVLRSEQVAEIYTIAPGAAKHLRQKPVSGDITPVAPGVVLLRTPGHTPGSQMIYVRLQDGREFLFTGDTASLKRNVSWLRPRSRLVADWLAPEDRTAVIGWLKGLADLERRNPGLTLVYSHDLEWLWNKKSGQRFSGPVRWPLSDNEAQRAIEEGGNGGSN